MKLKVVKQFKDKNDHKTIYQVGDVIDFKGSERIANLIKRDLCIPVDEEIEQPATEVAPATSANKPEEETPAKEKKSKGKTKKAEGEQPATGEVAPAESEDSEKEE